MELVTSSAVVVGEVSALAHEVRDDTVESGSFVPESLFSCAQRPEVFRSLWNHIRAELQHKSCRVIRQNVVGHWEQHLTGGTCCPKIQTYT